MLYTLSRGKPDLADCDFYYSQAFPSGLKVVGEWNLQEQLDRYTGAQDWTGIRVLDVGAASGTLSFYMELAGAEVVSLDVAEDGVWELLPFAGANHKLDLWKRLVDRLKNSYWFAYHEYQSSNKVVYCDVYNLPSGLGQFSHAVLGSVLLHLSNPFLALAKVASLVTKTIVVTDMFREMSQEMVFAPAITDKRNACAWWYIPPTQVERMLEVLGFQKVSLETFEIYSERYKKMSTFYSLVCTRKAATNG